MKAFFRRALAILLAGVMGGAVLTGCGSSTEIDGSKTVMTVNDEKVRLGVLSFYARYYQAMMTNYYGAMLNQQGAGMFDQSTTDSSDDTISTYGQSLRKSVLDDLEQMVVISQHAKDKKYNVSLTDDQKKQIKAAAKAYIKNNTEEVRKKIGASQSDVEKLMELQTIKSLMMDPMVKDVSTDVTQKEAQQSKVTYVSVAVEDTTSSSSSSSDASSVSEASASSVSTKEAKAQARAKAKDTAQKVLDAMKGQQDVASADMDAVAKTVDSSLSAVSGNYTTNDTTDGTVDSSIVKAVKGLTDGSLVDHVVRSSNKNNYYVVRFDKTDDEESTASKKESIVSTRKQEAYEKLIKKWVKKADIKVNNRVLKTLTITDQEPYTIKTESTASSTASSVAEASSEASSAASSTASSAASQAASASSSTASSATSQATSSAASSTASAAASSNASAG